MGDTNQFVWFPPENVSPSVSYADHVWWIIHVGNFFSLFRVMSFLEIVCTLLGVDKSFSLETLCSRWSIKLWNIYLWGMMIYIHWSNHLRMYFGQIYFTRSGALCRLRKISPRNTPYVTVDHSKSEVTPHWSIVAHYLEFSDAYSWAGALTAVLWCKRVHMCTMVRRVCGHQWYSERFVIACSEWAAHETLCAVLRANQGRSRSRALTLVQYLFTEAVFTNTQVVGFTGAICFAS